MIVVIVHQPPADAASARELLDMLVTLALFGLPMTLLFWCDLTRWIIPPADDQTANPISLTALRDAFGISALFAVDRPVLDRDVAAANGISLIDADSARALLARATHVLAW